MIRRFLTAMATALILYGVVGARLGQAQQQDNPASPSAPSDMPPDLSPGNAPPQPEPLLPVNTPGDPKTKKAPAQAPSEPSPFPVPESNPPDPPRGEAPLKDDEVIPAQADGSPLGPAKERPGDAATAASSAPLADPLILPPDRLPLGPSTASLSVEVQAPANANLNRPVKFKIFVKNAGSVPAMGVMVNDALPDKLEFVKSEPPATVIGGQLLQWRLDSLAAGAEKAITVTVIPRKEGDLDHAATVSLRTGSKSRTMVKHPRLKVEMTREDAGEVLKGRPVRFNVRVTNNGTGPARNVVVHSDLSAGLKHEYGSSLQVNFKEYLGKDALNPGESETIDLEVDAVSGGDQTCDSYAVSDDVEDDPEAHSKAQVKVVEPKLLLELKGPSARNTDTGATYTLKVANNGTATARKVVAAAFLPDLGGKLDRAPAGTTYTPQIRRLFWPVGELAPGEEKSLSFNVSLGAMGVFKVDASAKADGCPVENDSRSTQVLGMADIKCVVISQTRVTEVGEEMAYEIQLQNTGSKEAQKVQVTATVSDNLVITFADGTDKQASSSKASPEPHDCTFPPIDLAPKGTQKLSLRVKATKAGQAKCTVSAKHDDFAVENSTTTRVNEPR